MSEIQNLKSEQFFLCSGIYTWQPWTLERYDSIIQEALSHNNLLNRIEGEHFRTSWYALTA
jgi:hypothetical protein